MFSTHFQGFSSHFQGATSLHPQHIAPTATYSLYRAKNHPKKPPAGGFCARSDSLLLLLCVEINFIRPVGYTCIDLAFRSPW